jgi:hypothetical protein
MHKTVTSIVAKMNEECNHEKPSFEELDQKPSLLDLDVEQLFYGVRNFKQCDKSTSIKTAPLFIASTVLKKSEHYFTPRSAAFMKSIQGEDIVEMAKEYGFINSFYSDNVPIGVILSPCINCDFQVDYMAGSGTRFSQVEKVVFYCSYRLPFRPRMLLTDEAKADIDSIESLSDAEKVLALYGLAFFQSAVFGATMTWSARSSNLEDATDLTREMEMEALRTLESRVKLTPTKTYHTVGNSAIEYWVQARGGIPGLILEGKEIEWIKSVEVNPVVVDKRLAPLSDLAIQDSKAENSLRMAIQRRCHDVLERFKTKPIFPGPGRYYIRAACTAQGRGSRDEKSYLCPGRKHDTRSLWSTWVTCSKDCAPVMWDVVPASQGACETYYILTTPDIEHTSGWGLHAVRGSLAEKIGCLKGKSERSDDSTWVQTHKLSFTKWRIESSGEDLDKFRILLVTKPRNKMNEWMLAVDYYDTRSPTGDLDHGVKSPAYAMCHHQRSMVPQSLCADWIFEKVDNLCE